MAVELWSRGFYVYTPHLNSGLFDYFDVDWPDGENLFLKGHIAFLNVCDALFVMDNWQTSEGTREEIEIAKWNKFPIFYSLEDFDNYYNISKGD